MKELTPLQQLEQTLNEAVEQLKRIKEPKAELTTWEECAQVVKPRYFVDDRGYLQYIDLGYNNGIHDFNEVRIKRKHAKSVLAMCQLMTIAEALNGKYEGDGNRYTVHSSTDGNLVFVDCGNLWSDNPIIFTSGQSAQHSIDHFKQLWMDYFMVEGNDD